MSARLRSRRSAPFFSLTRFCIPPCGAAMFAPVAIGMTVTMCILGFGVLTGGSVNPARTIGPAVATGIYDGILVYLAAQRVGAICAGGLYRWFWITGTSTSEARAPR